MNENNNSSGAGIAYIFFIFAAELAVIMLKAFGLLPISWPAALLTFLWLPFPALALAVFVAFVLIITQHIHRRIRHWKIKRRAQRHFTAAKGKELDAMAKTFGKTRRRGESDRKLRKRIRACITICRTEAETHGKL